MRSFSALKGSNIPYGDALLTPWPATRSRTGIRSARMAPTIYSSTQPSLARDPDVE